MRYPTLVAAPLVAAMLLAAPPAAAVAQGAAEAALADSLRSRLQPGTRVRLRAPQTGDSLLTGTVDVLRGDSLVVRRPGGTSLLLVPTASLSRLDVRREDPDRRGAMTTLGVIGALAGGGVYLKWCIGNREACRNDGRGDPDDPSDDSTAFNFGSAMLFGGAAVGIMIGQALTPGHWEPVRLPVRLGVVPWTGGGLAVVAGFSFGPRPLRR